MIGTSANNADPNAISLVPSGKAIHDIDAVPGVEVVDGSFTVDSPHLLNIVSAFASYRALRDFPAREDHGVQPCRRKRTLSSQIEKICGG
jgi:hypothetical protein